MWGRDEGAIAPASDVGGVMLDPVEESDDWSLPEPKAYRFQQAARYLDQARGAEQRDTELVAALENNLELWVGIRLMVERADSALHLPRGNRYRR
jgi:hypothetical protein